MICTLTGLDPQCAVTESIISGCQHPLLTTLWFPWGPRASSRSRLPCQYASVSSSGVSRDLTLWEWQKEKENRGRPFIIELWPPNQAIWVMRLFCCLLLVPLECFWFLHAPSPGPQHMLDCVVRGNLGNSSNSLVVGSAGLNQRTIFLNQKIVAATSQKKPLLIQSAENWKMQSTQSSFGLKKKKSHTTTLSNPFPESIGGLSCFRPSSHHIYKCSRRCPLTQKQVDLKMGKCSL